MKQIIVNGITVPIVEMNFKELQEQYDGKEEVLGFYSQQHRNISICNDMDEQAKKDLIFHESIHALMNIKYDNLTDHFQLDEEATVRLITSCREDIVDIHGQIDDSLQNNETKERDVNALELEDKVYSLLTTNNIVADSVKYISICKNTGKVYFDIVVTGFRYKRFAFLMSEFERHVERGGCVSDFLARSFVPILELD